MPGKNISVNEAYVTNISWLGIWVLSNNKEYFISYKDYPVFQNADIKNVADVRADIFGNLHWPSLDADISIDALDNPEKYPLKDRCAATGSEEVF